MTRHVSAGFTLLELIVVVAIVASILAVALPRFTRTIAYADQEGSASHLANYGRYAFEHAALTGDEFVVTIDAKTGRYWTERIVVSTKIEHGSLAQPREFPLQSETGLSGIPEMSSIELSANMSARHEMRLRQKSSRIEYDREGLLADIDGLFRDDFSLETEVSQREPSSASLLQATSFPVDVQIVTIVRDGDKLSSDVVEILVGPTGFERTTRFVLAADGDAPIEVVWDAANQSTYITRPRAVSR